MARLMILNEYYPDDLTSGRDLRVNRFCAELARHHECFLVSFTRKHAVAAEDAARPEFRDTFELDDFRDRPRSYGRYFRLSNIAYMKKAWPVPFQLAATRVKKLQQDWNIDAAVNFTAGLSALALPLAVPKLLDRTDCDTLMLERRLANRGSSMSVRERASTRIELLRERRRERVLVNGYDAVTTIAEPDRQRFLEIGQCRAEHVSVVQNGVSELAMQYGNARKPADRSVVFWGNMDFAPNWTAVNYFYRDVFKPFLADQGVVFYVIGRGGEQLAKGLAADPGVKRLGFVPELFECLADKAVMVNPMVEGSGLKNKVLEAFAMRLPVVSTSLGVDALPVQSDFHLKIADDAKTFAGSVLKLLDEPRDAAAMSAAARQFVEKHYDWRRTSQQFASVVADLLAAKTFHPGPAAAPVTVDQ